MNNNSKNVVIITGAAGGIGREVAKRYAVEGAKLTLVDLFEEGLIETAKQLNLNEGDYLIVPTDVSKEEQVKNYVDQTINKFGKIDVFINNAGIEGKVQSIVETTAENLSKVLDVNVKGVYFGIKYVLPHMTEVKHGSIVNTASIAALEGSIGLTPYVASKHAVLGITRCASLEAAPSNVRVNAVCPGPVDNRMMRSIEEGSVPGAAEVAKEGIMKSIPMGRYATNEEVADLIYFLGSDKSIYITGVACRIDGGMGIN
ncbi:MAG: glucose 1-dehydrogenase [Bacilli bacterium]|nr:glucose 1-dehydrogenase [Bacilli bacterium]MDD3305389.1 glucose 1-dehydrogenase [Bacilli bacterium]MDD4054040.1 glucose 1-dehydrogenase [Bacilli bacterium]MDD4411828.1 glucose 1-dehydrogenase [Bacilli bacterium]